jgi:hypothetical protein
VSFFFERIEMTRAIIGRVSAERITAMNTNNKIRIRNSFISGRR